MTNRLDLPDNSIALVVTDNKDGSFVAAIDGDIAAVPTELAAMVVGAKRLLYSDPKTLTDAALEEAGDFELTASDDVTWADNTIGTVQ